MAEAGWTDLPTLDTPAPSGGGGTSRVSGWTDLPTIDSPRGAAQTTILPYQAPTWRDYGALAVESLAHTTAGVYDAAGYPEKGVQWRQTAKDWGDSVSPDARANFEANLGSQRWREHPFSNFALNAIYQAPQLGAIAGSEAVGGPVAAAGMGAFVYGAGAVDAFSESVDNTPDDQLGLRFQQLKASGMSSQDAKNQIKNETIWSSGIPEIAGALGAGVGVLGPVGQFARGPLGGAGIRATVGRMGVSGVEAGLVAGGQDLGTNLALNQAYGQIGVPQMTPEELATSAGKQALEMGAFSALGGIGRGRPEEKAPPPLAEERPPVEERLVTAREEPGVSPTADRSAEPSQTPSAPLRSAQAAPLMPERDVVATDQAKKEQAQARHETPVSGENVSIRSSREGRTKPAAGRDFGRTDVDVQEGGQSIAPSPVSDDHAAALKAEFEIEQQPTTDSRLPPQLRERLNQFTPEQHGQLVDALHQSGQHDLADMLSQELNVQRPPVETRGAPQEPAGGLEARPATPVAAPPVKGRPALPERPTIEPVQARAPPIQPEPTIPAQLREPTVPTRTVPIEDVIRTGRVPTAEERAETVAETAKPGHKPEWQLQARNRNNALADRIVHDPRYAPKQDDAKALLKDSEGGKGALVPLRARAQAMLDEAEGKVKIPDRFVLSAEGGIDHAPSVMLLDETRRFLNYTKGKISEADRINAVRKFLFRRNDLLKGEYEDILKERSKEAEAAKIKKKEISRGQKAVTSEELAAKEEQLSIVRPSVRTPEQELVHKERIAAAIKLLQERVQRYVDATKVKGKVSVEHMQELKVAADEAIEQARELGVEIPKNYKLSDITKKDTVTVGEDRTGYDKRDTHEAKPIRSTNIRDGLANLDYSKFHPAFRGMIKILVRKLRELAGDTPIHIFNSKEWLKFMDDGDRGIYDPDFNHIAIHQDYENDAHTLIHEALHAATIDAYDRFPEFKALVSRLYKEIVNSPDLKWISELTYGYEAGKEDPIEMLNEMMSNYEVQGALKNVLISPELAEELGVEGWRHVSFFRAILEKLLDALGFEPKYYTAMEAAASLSEQMMWAQYPAEHARAMTRLDKLLREREKPTIDSRDAYKLTSNYYHEQIPDKLKEGYKDIRDRIKYEPGMMKLKLKEWFETPRDWGVQLIERGHFKDGSVRSWIEHMSKQGYDRTQILKKYLDVASSIATLGVKKPQEFTKLVDLLLSAARHGAHPDEELGKGRNEFLKVTNPNHWEALAGHFDDRKKYLALDTKTQEIFRNIRDKMTEIHIADLKAARKSLVDNYRKYANKQSSEFQKVFEKVAKDEELTPKENEEFGSDPYLQDIHTYNRMIGSDAGKMFYFPMKRTAWKFAITGTHDYKAPTLSDTVRNDSSDPHRWIFDNENEAYKFTSDVGLPSYRQTRYYYDKDEKGNPMEKEYVTSGEVRQIADENVKPKKEIHVVVDPEHTEFANSVTEGERIREKMKDIGVKDISGVMPVGGSSLKRYGFFGPQIEAMKNRVGKIEGLTLSEQRAAEDAIEHTAIASMRGNYLPQSLLPRRRIMGTDNIDIIKAFWDRVRASANFQTMAEHRNEIDDSLKAMKDEVKSKRTHADATELNAFYNMIENRTMNFATNDLDNINMSTTMHHIQSWAVIKYLASPAFLAYHQLHIPLVVIPRLAKEIGWFPAFRMALNVYKQMLGGMPVIGKGLKGGWDRAWNYDKEPTNFFEALQSELKKHGGKDDELRAAQWAMENDLIHHTGIDFSSNFKGMGTAERLSQRMMNVSSEIIGSADQVNRYNSFQMFYRAARDKLGMDEEKAMRWAGDRVAETQGQFTAFNRVGLMRTPIMRTMLQFKSFPLILLRTVTKALYNSLRWGASMDERVDAIKTLAGLMGASMVLSGVQGAVPEPIEDLNNVANAFGLAPSSWNQYEDKLREYVADNMGADIATYVMNGVVGGGLGVDLTHRGGISNLSGLARINVTKPQDLENALFKWMAGVPGSILGDGIDGMNSMETGNWTGVMKGFLPRVITDPVKAYQIYNQGVTTRAGKVITPPLGLPDTLKQAFGFAPLTASHAREARYLIGEERAQQQTARTRIEKMYVSGNKGDAIRAMNDYNRANPTKPLKLGDLQKAQRETTKQKIFGYDVKKKEQQEMRHKAEVYGVPTQ